MQDQDTVPVILLGLMVSLLSSVFLLRCLGFHWVSGMQMMTTVTLEIFKSLFALHCRFLKERKKHYTCSRNTGKTKNVSIEIFLFLFQNEHNDYRFSFNSSWRSTINCMHCLSHSLPFLSFRLTLDLVIFLNYH